MSLALGRSTDSTSTDPVVVCGGGAAGMAAAVSAARHGAHVWLVEAEQCLGGTVAHALIHTIGGIFDSGGTYINDGLIQELAETLLKTDRSAQVRRIGRTHVLNVHPESYQAAAQRLVASEPGISVRTRATIRAVTKEGNRITEVEMIDPFGVFRIRTKAVIDATGSAEVTRLVDPKLIQRESRRAAGGLIFRMRGVVAGSLAWPKSTIFVRAIRDAAVAGSLPLPCANAWLDVGVHDDEAYVKMPIAIPENWQDSQVRTEIERKAKAAQTAIIGFLTKQPAFRSARLCRTGIVGVRDGGRVVGEYCLTADDVRRGRQFEDVACRCAWPIEFWDPEQGVKMEYLPDGSSYDIPLRSLKVKGVDNLWVAGKCLSADQLAQASARIAGCCWSMGEAAGRAAASN